MIGVHLKSDREFETDFYITGGTLRRDAACYVAREADSRLYENLTRGEYCYALTARQMGKSSLMVRAAARLREEGAGVAVLDLTATGQNITAEQWYYGLLGQIGRQLDLEDEFREYWLGHRMFGPLQRWLGAIREVLLPRYARRGARVVIFIDEIDAVRSLPFSTDEFFAGIRELYNTRAEDAELERLAFCLLGVATPSDLIRDTRTTPFNIGRRIDLRDFTPSEASLLARGLRRDEKTNAALLNRVLYWTGGHPYLTQRLCQAVAEDASVEDASGVDRRCAEMFLSPQARVRDDNLLFVRERLLRSEVDLAGLLSVYAEARRRKRVRYVETDPFMSVLRLSGVARLRDGSLQVRNRIYERVFDQDWIKESMPEAETQRQRAAFRRGARRALALAAVVVAVIAVLAFTATRQRDRAEAEARRADSSAEEARGALAEAQRQRLMAEQERIEADEQRRRAEAQRLIADEQGRQASAQQLRAERQEAANSKLLYAAQMNLAGQDWQTANISRMRELVESHWPRRGQEDLRGFEWYYFWQLLHGYRLSLPHGAAVFSVAFSPDGKKVAIGGHSLEVKVWDAGSGREIKTLKDYSSPVKSVAFSPDGAILATGSYDGGIRLWDTATWRTLATVKGHKDQTSSIAFSPDGKTLASGSWDGYVKLWDVGALREIKSIQAHTNWVWAVAFSPNGQTLASASEDHTIKLWSVKLGWKLATFNGHKASVYSVAFSPDGSRLASGGNDHTAMVWDVATAKPLTTLNGHALDVYSVAFSPDGRRLATGSWDRQVKLWDMATWREIATIKGNAEGIWAVAFSPDGKTLITGGEDATAKLWDVNKALESGVIGTHLSEVNSISFSPDGKRLATASNLSVKVWSVANGQLITSFTNNSAVRCIAYAPDGKTIAVTGARPDIITLWNSATDQKLILKGHGGIFSLAWSPDGKTLASGSRDSTIKLWDVGAGREIAVLRGHTRGVKAVVFYDNGSKLASGADDSTVRLWDVGAEREITSLNAHEKGINSIALSSDNRTLATGSEDRTIKLWDMRTLREVGALQGHSGAVRSVAFSPDGRRLVSGGEDNTVKIWDTDTNRELTILHGHTDFVYSVAFSPDGKTLASCGRDSTARLWRAATEREVLARNR
ncbi:MAG TPA: AAA-like domain-containing protein [Blastocatellia bacterium]|jgi:WD40 repeat protein|nr:AAA-like domain-containing protein [Blastocatellia bacterium]